jgi:HEAT repeat protein
VPPALQLLELLAGAGSLSQRRGAATALGIMGCEDAIPLLLAAVDPESPSTLRSAAVDSLGAMGHLPAAEPLAVLAENDTEPNSLRAHAVRALGRIGSPESLPIVSRLAQSPSEAVRLRAAQALGSFRSPEAVTRLDAMTDDRSTAIAQAAIQSLGQIGDPAVPTLSALATRGRHWPLPMLRTLVTALAECPGAGSVTPLGLLATSAESGEIRVLAAAALSNRREPECVPFLNRFLDHPPGRYQYGFALRGLAHIATDEAVDYVVNRFARQDHITHHHYRDETREALRIIAARDPYSALLSRGEVRTQEEQQLQPYDDKL